MGQRFGRNQRRRAREALAAMTAEAERMTLANSMNQGLLRQVSDDKAELLKVLASAREVLGNHPALPPDDMGNHPHPLGGDFDMPVQSRLGLGVMDYRPDEPLVMKIARMHQLLARVNVDKLSGEIHCHVLLDSGHAAYAISRDALYSMRRHPRRLEDLLTSEIAPRLGRQLANVLSKGGA